MHIQQYFISDFIEIQRNSFNRFLEKGLIEEFSKRNPISQTISARFKRLPFNSRKSRRLGLQPLLPKLRGAPESKKASDSLVGRTNHQTNEVSKLHFPQQFGGTKSPSVEDRGNENKPNHRSGVNKGIQSSIAPLGLRNDKKNTKPTLGTPILRLGKNPRSTAPSSKQQNKRQTDFQISKLSLELFFYPEYYQLSLPKYTTREAIINGKSYSSKLYIPAQLTDKLNKRIKLKWVLIGNLPLMTKHGHFILNGAPRVIVNQIIRSPGIYYQEKIHAVYKNKWSEKPTEIYKRFYADLICLRGTWLRIEMDKTKRIWAQMKKGPKIPILWFLLAMGLTERIIFKSISDSALLLKNFDSGNDENERVGTVYKNAPTEKKKKLDYNYIKTPSQAWVELAKIIPEINTLAVSFRPSRSDTSKTLSSKTDDLTASYSLNKTSASVAPVPCFWGLGGSIQSSKSFLFSPTTRKKNRISFLALSPTVPGTPRTQPEWHPNKEGNKILKKSDFPSGQIAPLLCSLSPFIPVPVLLQKKTKVNAQTNDRFFGIGASYYLAGKNSRPFKSFYTSQRFRLTHLSFLFRQNGAGGSFFAGLKTAATRGDFIMFDEPVGTHSSGTKGLAVSNSILDKKRQEKLYPQESFVLPAVSKNNAGREANADLALATNGERTGMGVFSLPLSKTSDSGAAPLPEAALLPGFKKPLKKGSLRKVGIKSPIQSGNPLAQDNILNTNSLSELGRKWIFNKFLNPRNYDLGKQGRTRFNKKLGLDISIYHSTLTPQDLLLATEFLLKVEKGLKDIDDIDHLANKRVRMSGDLLQIQVGIGLLRLEKIVRESFISFLKQQKNPLMDIQMNPAIVAMIRSSQTALSKIGNNSLSRDTKNNSSKQIGNLLSSRFLFRQTADQKNKKGQTQLAFSDFISTKAFNSALREFFGSNPLSQFMDQINPLAEVTHKRRLTSMGPGGITRDTATLDIRGIHPSHYGRICPIETPEGKNTGLVNSMTAYARVNTNGALLSPFYKVYKGQVLSQIGMFFLASEQEEKIILAASDSSVSSLGFLPKGKIPVKITTDFKKKSRDFVHFVGVSPVQMISIATSLIPFLEHDDANRALMGSNMQRQAVPLIRPEKPIVGTGFEPRVVCDSGQIVQVEKSGFVVYVSSQKIIVLQKN